MDELDLNEGSHRKTDFEYSIRPYMNNPSGMMSN